VATFLCRRPCHVLLERQPHQLPEDCARIGHPAGVRRCLQEALLWGERFARDNGSTLCRGRDWWRVRSGAGVRGWLHEHRRQYADLGGFLISVYQCSLKAGMPEFALVQNSKIARQHRPGTCCPAAAAASDRTLLQQVLVLQAAMYPLEVIRTQIATSTPGQTKSLGDCGTRLYNRSLLQQVLVLQAAIYPLEVIRTQIATSTPGQTKSLWDCATRLFKTQGVRAFYRGVKPSLVSLQCCTLCLVRRVVCGVWVQTATAAR
jgi:Mitochondrial carrier protein